MAAQDVAAETAMSPLAHLTSQSAAFGLWEVLIFAPDAAEREYIYQGKKRTAYNFRCLLVSTKEPTQYVLGESRGKRHEPSGPQRHGGQIQAGPCVPHDQTKFRLQCEATVQQRPEERSRLYDAHDFHTSPE